MWVHVHLTPNASRDEIIGRVVMADDKIVLKIKVRAVPEKGKANKALCVFLAKQLGMAKSMLSVTSGHQSRHKVIEITGNPDDIAVKLQALAP